MRLLSPHRRERHTKARINTSLGSTPRVTQTLLLIDKRAGFTLPMERVSLLVSTALVEKATTRIPVEMRLAVPDRTCQNEETQQQFPQQWYHDAIGDGRFNSQKPNMLKALESAILRPRSIAASFRSLPYEEYAADRQTAK